MMPTQAFLSLFSNSLTEAEALRRFSCVMALLPDEIETSIRAYQNLIEPGDIHEEGLETEFHVTILYGLHDTKPDRVKEITSEQREFVVTLKNITVFENEQWDVLKVEVSSPELVKLNRMLKQLPHTSTFPEYRPHMTIGYLKKGEGRKYAGHHFYDIELEVKRLKFSSGDGLTKTTWDLRPD